MAVQGGYNFIETVVFALGGRALVLRWRCFSWRAFGKKSPLRISQAAAGGGIAFIIAGLLSLAFSGFAGLI